MKGKLLTAAAIALCLVGLCGLTTYAQNLDKQLVVAAEFGKIDEVKKILAQNKDKTTAIMGACFLGDLDAVKKLLSEGVHVNVKEPAYGNTPLCFASFGGHKEIVKLLIDKGADVNVKNKLGGTPISLASAKSYQELVDLLKKSGAQLPMTFMSKGREAAPRSEKPREYDKHDDGVLGSTAVPDGEPTD